MPAKLTQSLWISIGVSLGIVFIVLLLNALFADSTILGVLIPATLLYVPLVERYLNKFSFETFGLRWRGLRLPELRLLAFAVLVFLLPFVSLIIIGQHFSAANTFSIRNFPTATESLRILIVQIVVVAFPEEFFFRGYLQQKFEEALHEGIPSLPVRSLVASNLFFTAAHLLEHQSILRLLTFFPGLVFGWLFWRSKNLFVPVIFHALCNISLFILTVMYRG